MHSVIDEKCAILMVFRPIAETLGFPIEQTQKLKTLCVFIRCLEDETKGSYSSCTHDNLVFFK